MKTRIIAIALALVLAACGGADPEQKASSTNPEVPVDKLFQHEGCTVFRFRDAGYYRYFTKCEGAGRSAITSQVSCGKSCTRPDDIPTN